jgi:serine O-acetyltransferase
LDKLKIVWSYINVMRTIPALFVYLISNQKSIIKKDINRWFSILRINDKSFLLNLNWLLLYYPQYRNLFYYRLKQNNPILSKLISVFYTPMQTLYIYSSSIGAGLFIQHGFSTIIASKSIGENCWINQEVTLGFSNDTDSPIIGNNVRITSGAKIIGKVTIGDNSIIGANSVVVKDVPADCTVIGNPALIVKRNGIKTREYLA